MRTPSLTTALLALAALLAPACNSAAPIHPPGSAALVGCAGELDWIHLDSGLRKRTYATTPRPDVVRVAQAGGQVAILDRAAETVTVFDAVDRVQRRVIALPAGSRPVDVDFADRRSKLAVAAAGGTTLYLVGTRTGDTLVRLDCGATPVAVAPFDDALAVAFDAPASVGVVTADLTEVTRRLALPATPTDVAAHPDRDELWLTSANANTLMIADVAGSEVRVAPCPGGPSAIRVTYDGARALVLCAASGDVACFDTKTRAELWRATPAARKDGGRATPIDIELEPPGAHLLVVISDDDRLDELDVASGAWVRSMRTAPRPGGVGWLRVRANARMPGGGLTP